MLSCWEMMSQVVDKDETGESVQEDDCRKRKYVLCEQESEENWVTEGGEADRREKWVSCWWREAKQSVLKVIPASRYAELKSRDANCLMGKDD